MPFEGLTFYDVLWFFILYAVMGWCVEVVFCSANTGKFVNRGFLNGSLCPIYGFGVVLIVGLLQPFHNTLLPLYLLSALLCSLLELVGGFILKKVFHTTWWDYSDQPFNLGGHVCLKFSLLWGVACVVVVRVVHPLVATFVAWLPQTPGIVLLAVFYGLLLADLIVTVAGIRKLNRDLGELARVAQGLHAGSDKAAERLGNTAIALAGKVDELDLDGKKQQLLDGMNRQKEKLQQLMERRSPVRNRLLKAFPDMKNHRFNEALQQLKAALDAKKKKPEKPEDEQG